MQLTQNHKLLSFALLAAFAISWIAPIGFSGTKGYGGAEMAYGVLKQALENLLVLLKGVEPVSIKLIYQVVGGIFVGSPNIFFVIGFVLFFFHRKSSLLFCGPAVISMLYWGLAFGVFLGIGYYLWLFSGGALFYFALNDFKASHNLTWIQVYRNPHLYLTYFVIFVLLTGFIIETLSRN